MKHARAMLWTGALAAAFALLIGYFALRSDADQAPIRDPYDQANHHPKQAE